MNLLQELLEMQKSYLKENDDLEQKLQDMFSTADEAGKLQPYIKNETIQARPASEDEEINVSWEGEPRKTIHAHSTDFVVRDSENPNSVKVLTKIELEKEYELEKNDSKPDAEGFISYRPKGQILAFQYEEHETLALKDEHGHLIHVKFGDYLGYPIDDETTLIQLDKSHFEKSYRLAD